MKDYINARVEIQEDELNKRLSHVIESLKDALADYERNADASRITKIGRISSMFQMLEWETRQLEKQDAELRAWEEFKSMNA